MGSCTPRRVAAGGVDKRMLRSQPALWTLALPLTHRVTDFLSYRLMGPLWTQLNSYCKTPMPSTGEAASQQDRLSELKLQGGESRPPPSSGKASALSPSGVTAICCRVLCGLLSQAEARSIYLGLIAFLSSWASFPSLPKLLPLCGDLPPRAPTAVLTLEPLTSSSFWKKPSYDDLSRDLPPGSYPKLRTLAFLFRFFLSREWVLPANLCLCLCPGWVSSPSYETLFQD